MLKGKATVKLGLSGAAIGMLAASIFGSTGTAQERTPDSLDSERPSRERASGYQPRPAWISSLKPVDIDAELLISVENEIGRYFQAIQDFKVSLDASPKINVAHWGDQAQKFALQTAHSEQLARDGSRERGSWYSAVSPPKVTYVSSQRDLDGTTLVQLDVELNYEFYGARFGSGSIVPISVAVGDSGTIVGVERIEYGANPTAEELPQGEGA